MRHWELYKCTKNGMAPGNFCVRGLRSLHWLMVGRKAEKAEGAKSQEAVPSIETFFNNKSKSVGTCRRSYSSGLNISQMLLCMMQITYSAHSNYLN